MEVSLLDIPSTQKELGGISRSKVYDLIWSGKLSVRKIGRRTLILRESVERIAANGA